MNTFLFNPDYMAKYYNCSGRTYEEWKAFGHPNIILGFVYVLLGFVCLTLLIPFMIVFIKTDLMKYSCYKIMFFIGIIDCLELPIGGFYCGYGAAIGMVYCMAPTVNYIIGGLSLACWTSGSMSCVLLAINRCIDLIDPQLGRTLFSGKKTFIWLLLPVCYFIYFFFFHTIASFNSNLYAFFFDPFVGTPERHGLVDSEHYPHTVQAVHNILVVIILPAVYASLLIHLSVKAAKSHDLIKINKIQRHIFIQCTLICTASFIGAIIYVYMQFFPTPVWLVVCAEIAWQLSHGAAGISYAFFNPTMRKELVKIFRTKSITAPTTGTSNGAKPIVPGNSQSATMNY